MSLSGALSSRLRELRKWDLGPIGAILVVVVLALGGYFLLTAGGAKSNQDKVRAYFMSDEGGGATKAEARRIAVTTCQPTGDAVQNELVLSCAVTLDEQTYTGCYAWDGEKLVAGGSRQVGDCMPVVWDERTHSLLGLREDQ